MIWREILQWDGPFGYVKIRHFHRYFYLNSYHIWNSYFCISAHVPFHLLYLCQTSLILGANLTKSKTLTFSIIIWFLNWKENLLNLNIKLDEMIGGRYPSPCINPHGRGRKLSGDACSDQIIVPALPIHFALQDIINIFIKATKVKAAHIISGPLPYRWFLPHYFK